ncbi:MAG: elongation factor [Myxococcaceae bacterium]|nr:elongation factor [Myxococcaceae bacterium]
MPRDIPLERVRNIGVMAHIDAGKTTITERILLFTGRIHRSGEVHHGNTAMDFSPEEQAMGITINAAATTTHWAVRDGARAGQRHRLNVIDTPGHVDFTMEVERSLRVLDGAVAVFDAARGVEPQTETVWRQADRYGVPRVAFVNKVDKPGADFAMCLDSMRRRLGARPVAVQLPLDAGLIDLVRDRAVVYGDETGRTFAVTGVPAEHRAAATRAREQLIEACAECDPSLTDAYLAGGPAAVSADDIERALRVATIAGRLVPVLCGSALKNRGIQMLLDAIVNYLPSPRDLPPVEGTHPDTGAAMAREIRDDGPVCALAFKVVSDRAQGTLTFLRVYSGTVRPGMALLDTRRGKTERVGRLVQVHADEREAIDEAPAGAIAAVLGWRDVRTGTTLCSADEPMQLVGLTIPEPMVEVALEPRTAGDSDRMTAGLARLAHEDPSLHVGTDPESGQTVVKGMGELHLEIVVERLRREHRAEVRVGEARVAYRETVRGVGEATYRHVRQEGGTGQFAHVALSVEPGARGSGLVFTNDTVGGVIPQGFIPSIEKGVRGAMARGVATGHPMVDVRVRLLDGSIHKVDSSGPAFEIAGSRAFQEAAKAAGVVGLEPVMAVEVTVPEDYVGEALASVQSRRGTVRDLRARGVLRVVDAAVPLARLFGYVTELRSRTQGRGSAVMAFSHYDEMPRG